MSQIDEKADDIRSRIKTSKPLLLLFIALSVAIFTFSAYIVWGRSGRPRGIAHRAQCCRTLQLIYIGIQKHLSDFQHLPRDQHGRLSVRKLADQYSDEVRLTPCRGEFGTCYLVNPKIGKDDFSGNSPVRLVICDAPGNHVLRFANGMKFRKNSKVQIQANLLLTNGNVIKWFGDLEAFTDWKSEFVVGKETLPPGIDSLDEFSNRPTQSNKL